MREDQRAGLVGAGWEINVPKLSLDIKNIGKKQGSNKTHTFFLFDPLSSHKPQGWGHAETSQHSFCARSSSWMRS